MSVFNSAASNSGCCQTLIPLYAKCILSISLINEDKGVAELLTCSNEQLGFPT